MIAQTETPISTPSKVPRGLKIGYMVPEFPTQTHIFFWREVIALRGGGHSIELISTRRPPADSCRHEFAAAARAETLYLWPPSLGSIIGLLMRPRSVWRCLAYVIGLRQARTRDRLKIFCLAFSAEYLRRECLHRGISHVHCHSCADAAHVVAIARLLGGPQFSLTLHGNLSVYGADHSSKMLHASFLSAVGKHLSQEIIENHLAPPERVKLSFMGIDTQQFRPVRELRQRRGRLVIATVARLHYAKGHRFALAAMRRAIDANLDLQYVIAGAGPHEEEIRAEISHLNLKNNVELLGTLSESEVLCLLQSIDVFVLPSVGLGEAWPVSVMEAMACGVPVVASKIGATPEMIASGIDGLLVGQGDVEALFEAFVQLMDCDRRERIGEAARRTAVARFDRNVSASALLAQIYHSSEVGPESTTLETSSEAAPCESCL